MLDDELGAQKHPKSGGNHWNPKFGKFFYWERGERSWKSESWWSAAFEQWENVDIQKKRWGVSSTMAWSLEDTSEIELGLSNGSIMLYYVQLFPIRNIPIAAVSGGKCWRRPRMWSAKRSFQMETWSNTSPSTSPGRYRLSNERFNKIHDQSNVFKYQFQVQKFQIFLLVLQSSCIFYFLIVYLLLHLIPHGDSKLRLLDRARQRIHQEDGTRKDERHVDRCGEKPLKDGPFVGLETSRNQWFSGFFPFIYCSDLYSLVFVFHVFFFFTLHWG